ncbi:HNH endonuclease signature motif containing protein [Actinomycetospora sp. TBRC 11914]|uniref:HNH endonuclease signature motif containing protein n=1 Tax=Actinomycetospora sp. TBRC 11914 TaxID=2729387 RepID=UPI00145E8358|nr:HNH endonuclease signature motif containing protein [Actinomycetospora sp. TBRC 11914]NMO92801.1 HNH endonuclease [Actinomycetospora sp. TBRC 11914]
MAVVVDEAVLGGLDALPAGPALAAEVGAADPAALTGDEAAAWLRAGFRQRNHADWQLLVALREACSARAGTTVRVGLDEFAPKIAAANLGWSPAAAGRKLDLAVGVLERMPALGERMRRGSLELAKAAAFVTGLDGLTDAQCAEVLDKLLDEAAELPLGQLRDRILAAGYAVDPVWGANRLAAATARARVSTETNPSGAVNVCGRDLDPALAQDAARRLRTLALAVRRRLRSAGCRRALGFIEARVFIRLLDGTLAAADDTTLIDALTTELTHLPDHPSHPDDDGPDDRGPDDRGPSDAGDPWDDGGPDDRGPNDRGPSDDGPWDDGGPSDDGPSDEGGPDDRGPDDRGPDGSGPDDDGPDDDGPDDGGPDDRGPDDGGPWDDGGRPPSGDGRDDGVLGCRWDGDHADGGSGVGRGAACGSGSSVVFVPGIAVRLELSTLLGLDEHPGVLPGLGPVPAATARRAALARGAAQWQVLVHDRDGHLTHLLTLRAPPQAVRDPRHRRQSVQITAPAALLGALDPSGEAALELPGVGPVVLDAATTAWLRRARDALIASRTADPEAHPASTTRERDRRFPSARLAAWVQARDQTCVAPGCPRPAETCDVDHTLDWLLGGRTEARGLEALCRHDHRAKHEGGWHYQQPEPGQFVITDPTGTRHRVESRVVHPLPDPVEPGHGIAPDPGPPPAPGDWAIRRTPDGRITPKARDTAAQLATRDGAHRRQPPSRYDHDPDF